MQQYQQDLMDVVARGVVSAVDASKEGLCQRLRVPTLLDQDDPMMMERTLLLLIDRRGLGHCRFQKDEVKFVKSKSKSSRKIAMSV